MNKGIIITLTIVVVASAGIVVMQSDQGQQDESPTQEGRMDVPEMNSRYIDMISPAEKAEPPVRFRFDANTSVAESYAILVDGEQRASGELESENLETLELSSGSHTYTVELLSREEKVDTTGERELEVVNGTYIELIRPDGNLESGDEVEFVYSVNGSETAELYVDGEKIAEDVTEDVNSVNVTDIGAGEHIWSVRANEESREKEFFIEQQIELVGIHDFRVLESEEGWQARIDISAQSETDYTVYVDDRDVQDGLLPAGDSSLGVPLNLDGEHTVHVRFRNAQGEARTEEVTVDAS